MFFTAKKEIPQDEVNVEGGQLTISPPRTELLSDDKTIVHPATVDFRIPGVDLINLTDTEWTQQKAFLIKVVKRAPNLKDVISL